MNGLSLHWLRPSALVLLLPYLLLLALHYGYRHHHQHSWRQVCDPHLLKALSQSVQSNTSTLRLLSIAVGALLIVALAGPSLWQQPLPLTQSGQPVMILLDASSAMTGQDLLPNRFDRAKFALIDLMGAFPDNQWGLIAYTGEPFVITPITQDTRTLTLQLNQLNPSIMPIDGNGLDAALTMAQKKLPGNNARGQHRGQIVVVTAQKANASAITIAKRLASQGITTSVLAMGTALGAPIFNRLGVQHISKLPQQSLQQLAEAGHGQYWAFDPAQPIPSRFTQMLAPPLTTDHPTTAIDGHMIWQDHGRYLILLALPWIAYCFRRGVWESL